MKPTISRNTSSKREFARQTEHSSRRHISEPSANTELSHCWTVLRGSGWEALWMGSSVHRQTRASRHLIELAHNLSRPGGM